MWFACAFRVFFFGVRFMLVSLATFALARRIPTGCKCARIVVRLDFTNALLFPCKLPYHYYTSLCSLVSFLPHLFYYERVCFGFELFVCVWAYYALDVWLLSFDLCFLFGLESGRFFPSLHLLRIVSRYINKLAGCDCSARHHTNTIVHD